MSLETIFKIALTTLFSSYSTLSFILLITTLPNSSSVSSIVLCLFAIMDYEITKLINEKDFA